MWNALKGSYTLARRFRTLQPDGEPHIRCQPPDADVDLMAWCHRHDQPDASAGRLISPQRDCGAEEPEQERDDTGQGDAAHDDSG